MESNIVEDYFDNSNIGIQPNNALEIIDKYFQEHIASFDKIKENSNPPFWYIEFSKGTTSLIFEGDSGFTVNIKIDGKNFPLWSFDRRVNDATKSNEKNIFLY